MEDLLAGLGVARESRLGGRDAPAPLSLDACPDPPFLIPVVLGKAAGHIEDGERPIVDPVLAPDNGGSERQASFGKGPGRVPPRGPGGPGRRDPR